MGRLNYKRLIQSRKIRCAILGLLSFVPDKLMIGIQYRIKLGRKIDWRMPQRFSDKLQLYKLKYRNADMLRCTDKYTVREYVKERGYEEYLIPLIGIYDNVESIDFNALPNTFVAKTTDGGGGNQVLVCKDKGDITHDSFKSTINEWMSTQKPKKHVGREWAYNNNLPRRIIIEQLIGDPHSKPVDYKFLCFDGKVKYIYVISDRKMGVYATLGIYNANFEKVDAYRKDELKPEITLSAPRNYQKMVEIAERLSEGFPHARVDLYNEEGSIYFGELTFYDGSGYISYEPDSFDFELGKHFDIGSFK